MDTNHLHIVLCCTTNAVRNTSLSSISRGTLPSKGVKILIFFFHFTFKNNTILTFDTIESIDAMKNDLSAHLTPQFISGFVVLPGVWLAAKTVFSDLLCTGTVWRLLKKENYLTYYFVRLWLYPFCCGIKYRFTSIVSRFKIMVLWHKIICGLLFQSATRVWKY